MRIAQATFIYPIQRLIQPLQRAGKKNVLSIFTRCHVWEPLERSSALFCCEETSRLHLINHPRTYSETMKRVVAKLRYSIRPFGG